MANIEEDTLLEKIKTLQIKETDDFVKLNKDVIILKPILKWVGGKTQILEKLLIEMPKTINNYHEIFIGGGSVLLAFLAYVNNKDIIITGHIYAYDINESLISVYQNIQSNHIELYNKLQELIKDFNDCGEEKVNRKPISLIEAKQNQENYYYWIRKQYNKLTDLEKKTVICSAMFIFLNKTCFRGVYRVGPNGFNVPYGHYKNPGIINMEHLNKMHDLIQNVIFKCCDFSIAFKNVSKDDYIYLDPPYAPESKKSFVNYTENGFNIEQHQKLFNLCDISKNVKIMMSNSSVDLVKKHFASDIYTINTILCKRAINSKKPDSKTNEVIIKNY